MRSYRGKLKTYIQKNHQEITVSIIEELRSHFGFDEAVASDDAAIPKLMLVGYNFSNNLNTRDRIETELDEHFKFLAVADTQVLIMQGMLL